MSKIGKLPITIGQGVTVTVDGRNVTVNGPKGNGTLPLPTGITVDVQEGKALVTAKNKEDRQVKALYGLTRANLANLIKGMDTGFEKQLEITGVGYRAQLQGVDLVLSLGFAHPVKFHPAKLTTQTNRTKYYALCHAQTGNSIIIKFKKFCSETNLVCLNRIFYDEKRTVSILHTIF